MDEKRARDIAIKLLLAWPTLEAHEAANAFLRPERTQAT